MNDSKDDMRKRISDADEQRLADYLSGELDERQSADFERRLAEDPRLDREARELRAAAAAVGMHAVDLDEAEARTRGATLPRGLAPAPRSGRWISALRYAAVILIAFGAGFWLRGRAAPLRAQHAPAPRPSIETQLIEQYARAGRENPNSSSFSRALLAVARR